MTIFSRHSSFRKITYPILLRNGGKVQKGCPTWSGWFDVRNSRALDFRMFELIRRTSDSSCRIYSLWASKLWSTKRRLRFLKRPSQMGFYLTQSPFLDQMDDLMSSNRISISYRSSILDSRVPRAHQMSRQTLVRHQWMVLEL